MPTVNPLVGLQPNATWQQGMPSLMGYAPQTAVLQQSQQPSLMTPGYWSQQAYKMAGSPIQGPFPDVPVPQGTGAGGSGSGGGVGGIGGTMLGLAGAILKNPSLMGSITKGIGGLFGSDAGSLSSIMAGGSPALAPIGVGDVSVLPSVQGAVDAGASGSGAATAGSAGGLLGGAGAASSAGSALGAGAPGVFASGNAAAGSAGASAGIGSGLGAGGLAIPLAAAMIPFGIGLAGSKANDQGNAAIKAWEQATGAKFNTSQTASGNSQFGLTSGQQKGKVDTGTYRLANGQVMTKAQAEQAVVAWAKQNGIPTGNLG